MSRARRIFGTTADVVGTFIKSGALVTSTSLLNGVKELTRMMDTSKPEAAELKRNIKDGISLGVSATTNIIATYDLYIFITRAISANVWQDLTLADKISIGVLLSLAIPAKGYSFFTFGVEQQMLASGLSDAAASAFFGFATTIVNDAVKRREILNEETIDEGTYFFDARKV